MKSKHTRYLLLKTMDDGKLLSGSYDFDQFCDKLIEAIHSRLSMRMLHEDSMVRDIEFEKLG